MRRGKEGEEVEETAELSWYSTVVPPSMMTLSFFFAELVLVRLFLSFLPYLEGDHIVADDDSERERHLMVDKRERRKERDARGRCSRLLKKKEQRGKVNHEKENLTPHFF